MSTCPAWTASLWSGNCACWPATNSRRCSCSRRRRPRKRRCKANRQAPPAGWWNRFIPRSCSQRSPRFCNAMSIDQEMEEILQLFFEESFEGLDTMESGLLTLDNSADRETINTIFRPAHSIKGGAGTFGFMEISGFTHSVETLLDEMRNGTRGITPDALQVLLQSVDVVREMVQSAQAKRPIVMVGATALSGELIRILAQKGGPVNSPAETAASNPPAPAGPPADLEARV